MLITQDVIADLKFFTEIWMSGTLMLLSKAIKSGTDNQSILEGYENQQEWERNTVKPEIALLGPEETKAAAKQAFSKGNIYRDLPLKNWSR